MVTYFLIFLNLFFSPVSAVGQVSKTFDIQVPQNSYKFVPEQLTIKIGDTVRWHNNDERIHVLASVPGSGPTDQLEIFSKVLKSGTTFSHTFKEPGDYPYFCPIHNNMSGLVIVQGKDK